MAVSEDLSWLVRDTHFARVRTGYYRDLMAQATQLGFDPLATSRIAKQVGCSAAVVDAILRGDVEPTVAQFRALNEALRTAVTPGPSVTVTTSNGAAS